MKVSDLIIIAVSVLIGTWIIVKEIRSKKDSKAFKSLSVTSLILGIAIFAICPLLYYSHLLKEITIEGVCIFVIVCFGYIHIYLARDYDIAYKLRSEFEERIEALKREIEEVSKVTLELEKTINLTDDGK